MSFVIKGTGSAVPEYVLTNEKLSTMVDTSDEWISTRTGIKERHICVKETLLDLATSASRDALEEAQMRPAELDYIICTTVQGDYITPPLACLVQKELGATCPAFDVNAACTGFLFALDLAQGYFDTGKAKNILVVSAENMSKFANWTDRSTCVLFGDAAGAVVLSKGEGLLSIKLTTTGDNELITIGGNQGNSPFAEKEETYPYLYMKGPDVYKFAVASMCNDLKDVVREAGLQMEDITHIIPHQANARIIATAKQKLKLREDQIVCYIDQYGNTSSSSVPLAIDRLNRDGNLRHGDIIALCAFGGGLTTGACIIRY